MTRQEKEKAVLMVLGLNVGDIVNISYFNFTINFRVIEHNYHYALERIEKVIEVSPSSIYLPITDLIKYNFNKVETIGSKRCEDIWCDNCPFNDFVSCCGTVHTSLYEMLELIREKYKISKTEYEQIKDKLDKEDNNAKETNE